MRVTAAAGTGPGPEVSAHELHLGCFPTTQGETGSLLRVSDLFLDVTLSTSKY